MSTMGNRGPLSPNRLKLTAPSVHGSCLVQVDDHHEDLLPRKSAIHPTGLSDVSSRIKGQRPRPPVGKPGGLSPLCCNENSEVSSSRRSGYGNNGIPRRKHSNGTTWDALDYRRRRSSRGQDTGRPAHENQSPRRKPPRAVGAISLDGRSHRRGRGLWPPALPSHAPTCQFPYRHHCIATIFLLPSITKVQLPTPEQSPEKVVPGDVNVTALFKLKGALTIFEFS